MINSGGSNGRRIWPVIKREVRVKLGLRFIITTLFIPLVMAAIIGTQTLLSNLKSEDTSIITVVLDNNDHLAGLIKGQIDELENVKSGRFKVDYAQVGGGTADSYVESKKTDLLADDNKSIFVVPTSAQTDKKISLYSTNPGNVEVRNRIGGAISKALNLNFLETQQIRGIDLTFVQTDVAIAGNKVSSAGTVRESWGPLIVGGVLALLLNLGITFNTMPLMSIVTAEKANRLYEILLTSLKPRDIMWGKIIGQTVIATLQMLIWIAASILLLLILNNFVGVSEAFRMELNTFVVLYYLVNYIVGLMLFLTLYVGLSSMYDNAGAASSALTPLYFVILVPMYTVFALLSNPANSVATVLSIIPITSLYVMPARMTLIDVPFWQPLLALALNGVLLYYANSLAGKIYRVSVLATGNSLSLRKALILARNA